MTVEQQILALVCFVSVALISKIAKRMRILTFDNARGDWPEFYLLSGTNYSFFFFFFLGGVRWVVVSVFLVGNSLLMNFFKVKHRAFIVKTALD